MEKKCRDLVNNYPFRGITRLKRFDLDERLLEACFEIQKKYQFNHDRTLSTQAIDRLIEDYVEKASQKLSKDGG